MNAWYRSAHFKATLQALLVTFLWSTSWVLIKFGLQDLPALTFAGLRYMLAFGVLLPFALRKGGAARFRALHRQDWAWLTLVGVIYYAVTQGTQFLALQSLPAVTLSLLLSFSVVLVALLAIPLLGERPDWRQGLGTLLFLGGVLIYFAPLALPAGQVVGLILGVVSTLSNAISSILGRQVNRGGRIDAMTVTVVSMGVGATLLLAGGALTQGIPRLNLTHWLIIAWLAVVNSAFAFTLWNHTLRVLPAVESTLINNTMLFQIAVLALIFLGEGLTLQKLAGMLVAVAGTLVVQFARRPSPPDDQNE
jgi:drug/metabolite transporter (DMT)-like permease